MLPSQQNPGASLADVLPSCLYSLGYRTYKSQIELPPAKSAVIVLIDGLGYNNLKRTRAHARQLWSVAAEQEPIRSIFPSTTSAALATFVTGELPGKHGITGYQVLDPRQKRLLNQLSDIGEATQPWLLTPNLFRTELSIHIIGHPRFSGSSLTQTLYQDSKYEAVAILSDRITKALNISQNSLTLSVVYISELDELAHKKGVESVEWANLLETVDSELHRLFSEVSPEVGILVTADHGVVDIPLDNHVLLGLQGELDNVAFVGGEPRCLQLYLSDEINTHEELKRIRSLAIAHVGFFGRHEVVNSEILGVVSDEIYERLGDIFCFADDGFAIYDARDQTRKGRQMIGQHGGCTLDELEIPLIRAGAYLP